MEETRQLQDLSLSLERETHEVGRQILGSLKPKKYTLFHREWWAGEALKRAVRDEAFKVALFRFVDVLPGLQDHRQVVRLLKEYFDQPGQEFPPILSWGLKTLSPGSPTGLLAARTIRAHVTRLAQQFILGRNLPDAAPGLRNLWEEGIAFSLALLGEVAVSETESAGYAARYLELVEQLAKAVQGWPARPLLEGDRFGRIPRANLSVKVTALYSQMDPMDWEGSIRAVCGRLRPILCRARELGGHIHLDMEHYQFKDLTLAIFFEAMASEDLSNFHDAGVVIQAYLQDAEQDLWRVLNWAAENRRHITVRLVKGAYWDYETIVHRQRGWPVPVFLDKGSTDANYERLTRILLDHAHLVRPAFAGHNVRSIAHAIAAARLKGLSASDLEFQVLYGMGGPLQSVLSKLGFRVRVYSPVGELLPGMAYLVRRLLENTSNESFVRKAFLESGLSAATLDPPRPEPPAQPVQEDVFRNEPHTDFAKRESREAMRLALAEVRSTLGRSYPLWINGKGIQTRPQMTSLDPADPGTVVGFVSSASNEDADRAVAAALDAFPGWRCTPPEDRARVLFRAAAEMRRRRFELAAWEVYEVGKTWREADADVAEAIDFLEYYGREMIRLGRPKILGRYPGEHNLYRHRPLGIGVVIAPWNFPLAIPAGMVSAALVTGNCVLFKPSELSPVMGHHLYHIFEKAGLPKGVLAFLPGRGEEVGAYLVRHPEIAFIAFTGSKAVGLEIVEAAGRTVPGQRQIKRVVAEMGGKNAIIVDDTADLDLAVQGVVASAMGYQGQKCSACSRVIVLESIYETFLKRLADAVRSLRIGPPADPANQVGPVIDAEAQARVQACIDEGQRSARPVVVMEPPPGGYYVGPAVFADVAPTDRLAQEELFGPVLAVLRAGDFEEAIRIANQVDYALTGGLYSRSPANIQRAVEAFEVGNLYINRGITGALVGRQPFGGFRMSGIGSKAGGPDYLLQFMVPRTVTENTLRRGFAPPEQTD